MYELTALSKLKPDWSLIVNRDDLIISDKNHLFDKGSDAIYDVRVTKVLSRSSSGTNITVKQTLDDDRIDTSSFDNGIYELKIKDKFDDSYSWKFVINNL